MCGYVFEPEPGSVVKEGTTVVAGEKDVGPTVAIVIADGTPHPHAVRRGVSVGRERLEPTVPEITKDGATCRSHQNGIRFAVTVEVGPTGPTRRGFENRKRRTVAVAERVSDTGFRRPVVE